jgi:hypothetical protein
LAPTIITPTGSSASARKGSINEFDFAEEPPLFEDE